MLFLLETAWVLRIITDEEVHSSTFNKMNKQIWVDTRTADHELTARTNLTWSLCGPLRSPVVTLSHSGNPFRVFQAHGQRRGSGGLQACSLVKHLNYVIDVSTVINLAAAHPANGAPASAAPWCIVKELPNRPWWAVRWSLLFWQVRRSWPICKLWGYTIVWSCLWEKTVGWCGFGGWTFYKCPPLIFRIIVITAVRSETQTALCTGTYLFQSVFSLSRHAAV